MENSIELIGVIFAILGVLGLAGTVIVSITPSDGDDKWWAKYILPILPVITMGSKANKIIGRGGASLEELKKMISERNK